MQSKSQPEARMTVRVYRADGSLKYEETVDAQVEIKKSPLSLLKRKK